jgi:GrpE
VTVRENLRQAALVALRGDEIMHLARRAEAQARGLNELAAPPEWRDLPVILRSTCTLLDWAADDRAADPPPPDVPAAPPPARPDPAEPPPERVAGDDWQPSATAEELIAVRDMILIALAAAEGRTRATFELLYAKTGEILQLEGLDLLDGDAAFDPAIHEAVDVHPTDRHASAGRIAETIRPGYRLGGRLVRPQQVAVYQFPGEAGDVAEK